MKKKFWTVKWKGGEIRKLYGILKNDFGIIPLEFTDTGIQFNVNKKKIGRPKMRQATIYPIFDTKDEAEAYRSGNEDWDTVQISVNCL